MALALQLNTGSTALLRSAFIVPANTTLGRIRQPFSTNTVPELMILLRKLLDDSGRVGTVHGCLLNDGVKVNTTVYVDSGGHVRGTAPMSEIVAGMVRDVEKDTNNSELKSRLTSSIVQLHVVVADGDSLSFPLSSLEQPGKGRVSTDLPDLLDLTQVYPREQDITTSYVSLGIWRTCWRETNLAQLPPHGWT